MAGESMSWKPRPAPDAAVVEESIGQLASASPAEPPAYTEESLDLSNASAPVDERVRQKVLKAGEEGRWATVRSESKALASSPTQLRDNERRLRSSTIFNTTPAGQASPKSYAVSPEVAERLAAGESAGRQVLRREKIAPASPPASVAPEGVTARGQSLGRSGDKRWFQPAPIQPDSQTSPRDSGYFFSSADGRGQRKAVAGESRGYGSGYGGEGGYGGGYGGEGGYGGGYGEEREALAADRFTTRRGFDFAESTRSELRQRYQLERPTGDKYAALPENEFTKPLGGDALSTFSVDVDTASYTNARQFLRDMRRLPPAASVRVEEFVNYFDYDYVGPDSDSQTPFAASMEVAPCPWKPERRLVRIGVKGREVAASKRPLTNLVFLVDVSGSMNNKDKLPLVIAGLRALTDRLGENDRVAIVVYAGNEGVVLPSTSGDQKEAILSSLDRLRAGGSTAGGAGLKLAYDIAERYRIEGGVNRVVLCTDGDFNVGLTGTEELTKLVETRAKETGVFLTVLGFGRGNLNDAMLESISGRGNGHYAYVDSEKEARRILSRDLSGTLVTIAKDVKLQVEFNPAKVAAYRLIGYENRVLAAEDFNDDKKDAGEIGAGHTVTALYEVVPVGVEEPAPPVDGLKYQTSGQPQASSPGSNDEKEESGKAKGDGNELLTLKIRYKQPDGDVSTKLEFPLEDDGQDLAAASGDFRWAAAVAEFAMLLRESRHVGDATLDDVLELARGAVGDDPQGYRAELLDLVRKAKEASGH